MNSILSGVMFSAGEGRFEVRNKKPLYSGKADSGSI
jgi:hypothetical protein